MDLDVRGDDELLARQADAVVGNERERNASSGLPTFIMILVLRALELREGRLRSTSKSSRPS